MKYTICMVLMLVVGGIGFAETPPHVEALRADQVNAVKERLAPVAKVVLAENKPVVQKAATGGADEGKTIYTKHCAACHASGIANAPKLGDKAVWDQRLAAAKSMDGLVDKAVKGLNAMPPKGMCNDCSNAQLKAAIEYMMDPK